MVESSLSYKKSYCCNRDCYMLGNNENQPCWGEVEVIDEWYSDDDWDFIHACEGHINQWGKYIPEPKLGLKNE